MPTQASMFSLTDHEIYVVTARHAERTNGQIATWILPGTLVPDRPRLVAVLSPMNFTHGLITASGIFAVSMLAHDQHALVPHFGLHSGRHRDKLAGIDTVDTPSGIPVIAGSCGWAECVIRQEIDGGDRFIYLADVTAQHADPSRAPLRRAAAFAAQPDDVRELLTGKQRIDGERDRELMRMFGAEA
jgi:flavin reductase